MAEARVDFYLTIPIAPGVVVPMQVPRPMTPDEWDQLHAVLAAMRPGLVEEPAHDPASGPEPAPDAPGTAGVDAGTGEADSDG